MVAGGIECSASFTSVRSICTAGGHRCGIWRAIRLWKSKEEERTLFLAQQAHFSQMKNEWFLCRNGDHFLLFYCLNLKDTPKGNVEVLWGAHSPPVPPRTRHAARKPWAWWSAPSLKAECQSSGQSWGRTQHSARCAKRILRRKLYLSEVFPRKYLEELVLCLFAM